MSKGRFFDAPLTDPDEDLLGMAAYAQTLAELITNTPPPFTIGIYGEWGIGKTSFVQLVRHFLDGGGQASAQPVQFIPFCAWPHKTSDQLWGALVLRLASEVFAPQDPPKTLPPSRRLRDRLMRALASDAVVINPAPLPSDDRAELDDILADFGHTPVTIRTGADTNSQINHEEALLALARTALASLGSLSPLAASLRSLFGIDSTIDLSQVLQREKGQALRERILSVEKVRDVVRKIFLKAHGKRLCVFIDDLDRCMPDVALDLLEAIKIFLEDAPCTFLVAADETLIGQGLRLRYRDLLEDSSGPEIQALLVRKGQEYFEKIIQLGIRVPQPTPEQTHRFIAAQYPEWLPATDIIREAIGDNPRRLKQFCNLLRYKYLAKTHIDPAKSDRVTPGSNSLLEKIFTIYSWKPQCLPMLQGIARLQGVYAEEMREIESCLQESEIDKPLPAAKSRLPFEPAFALYTAIVESAPLFQIFRQSPPLSEANADEIAAFSWLADLEPDSRDMLKASDACFMRIFEIAARQGILTPARLLEDDLARLVEISTHSPRAAALLDAIAQSGDWLPQMVSLESQLQSGTLNEDSFSESLIGLLREIRSARVTSSEKNELLRLFLQLPRPSSLLAEEILAFAGIREALPKIETLVSPEFLRDLSPSHRTRTLAVWAAEHIPPDARDKALRGLYLRVEAARYLLARRTFAKLDAFFYRWPDLAKRLRTDLSDLIALESQVIQPQVIPPQLERWWDYCRQDEQLLSFLRLRPLFRDMEHSALRSYFKIRHATDVTIQPTPQEASTKAASTQIEPSTPAYENVYVRLKALPDGERDAFGRALKCTLSLECSTVPAAQEEVQLPWDDIDNWTSVLSIFDGQLPARAEARDLVLQPELPGARSARSPGVPFDVRVRALGEQLYMWLFQGSVANLLSELLNSGKSLRFLWDMRDPGLMSIPLECIYIPPPNRTFPALTRRYSMVRHFPEASVTPFALRYGMAPPVRILAALPRPSMLSLIDAEGEEEILRRTLASAIDGGEIQLQVLRNVTRERFQNEIRTYQPHILHYVGHGVIEPTSGEPSLIIEAESGAPFTLPASDLPTLLSDTPLQLVVLNACYTSTSPSKEAIAGLTGALIGAGVPVAIGTLRQVEDEPALMFSREFYRTLASGYGVEAAVVEARKALSVEGWDWSVYSLFSSLTDLSSVRLITGQSRHERRAATPIV